MPVPRTIDRGGIVKPAMFVRLYFCTGIQVHLYVAQLPGVKQHRRIRNLCPFGFFAHRFRLIYRKLDLHLKTKRLTGAVEETNHRTSLELVYIIVPCFAMMVVVR